jgi:hypothetical protein
MGGHIARMGEDEFMYVIGGKFRNKETTGKKQQNVSG